LRSPRTSRSAEGASPSAGHDVIGAEHTDLRARLTRLQTQIARLVEFITDGERSPATDANLMALGTGLCIFQKRLEQGRFAELWREDGKSVRLTASELALFIEGCALVGRRTLSPDALVPTPLVSDR
jgi:hypothetical protein